MTERDTPNSPFWTCTCGAVNLRRDRHCEVCAATLALAEASVAAVTKRCADCDGSFRFWTELTQGEDGARRCASCHFRYLGRRAAGTTDQTVCTEPDCTKTVTEHRAELHATRARGSPPPCATCPDVARRRLFDPMPPWWLQIGRASCRERV